MRLLAVGDVHATPAELDDCRRLMALVQEKAVEHRVPVLLLGDLYHTMAVIRSEVMNFWRETFSELNAALEMSGWRPRSGADPVYALVGNHDYAGEGTSIHAMAAHQGAVHVVDAPFELGGVLYLPYYSDRQAFIDACQAHPGCPTVICHQTFDGARYDNNFYAPDGVDQDLIPQELVLSGHIHTGQSFGKITYLGAPRWRTLSDANIDRAIWLLDFDDTGRLTSKTPFDTGQVCRQIKSCIDTPQTPVEGPLDPKHDWRIDIKGPAAWIEQRKRELGGDGVKIRTFNTSTSSPRVRESEGIEKAFASYLTSFKTRYGTSVEKLGEMARERLGA